MTMSKEYHPFAAIFSVFFVGIGQIIKGDSKKGLKWILFFYLFIPATIYVSFVINAYLFIFVFGISMMILPVFWLYNVIDALFKRVL